MTWVIGKSTFGTSESHNTWYSHTKWLLQSGSVTLVVTFQSSGATKEEAESATLGTLFLKQDAIGHHGEIVFHGVDRTRLAALLHLVSTGLVPSMTPELAAVYAKE